MSITLMITWLALAAQQLAVAPVEIALIVSANENAQCLLARGVETDDAIYLDMPYCQFPNDGRRLEPGRDTITYIGVRFIWNKK